MTIDEISPDVRELINRHIRSIDHAEAVLHLAEHAERTHSPAEVAQRFHWPGDIAERVLRDLTSTGLVSAEGESYRYLGQREDGEAIARLDTLYHKQPVTLVRAIYAAPMTVTPGVRPSSDEARSSDL